MMKQASTLQKELDGVPEEDNQSNDESKNMGGEKRQAIDLKEKIQRKLTTLNPQAPKVLVRYNFLEKTFQKDEQVSQHVLHFSMDGETITKESNYLKDQEDIHDDREAKASLFQSVSNSID